MLDAAVVAQIIAAVPKREREQLGRELERHQVRVLMAAAQRELVSRFEQAAGLK
ncbi:MAG: hypothetical protein ACYCZD_08975 [Rhodanobacter sp.]